MNNVWFPRITMSVMVFLIGGIIFLGEYNRDVNAIDIEPYDITYVYQNGGTPKEVTGEKEIEAVKEAIIEKTPEDDTGKVVNTTYMDTKTLLEYPETTLAEVEEIQNQTKVLVEGHTITIDDKKLYVSDLVYFEEAINEIYRNILPPEVFDDYLETGVIDVFDVGNKKVVDVFFENDIEVEDGFVPGIDVIESTDEMLFQLLNYGQEPQEVVLGEKTYNDIMEEYELSDIEFYLNNLQSARTKLSYPEEELIVNKPSPIANLAIVYETTKEDVIGYATIEEEDDSLDEGSEVVRQYGKDGLQNITYQTKLVNGKEIYTEATNYDVVKRPVNEIIAIGTKKNYAPSIGSGQFTWPGATYNMTCGWYCYPGHDGMDVFSWYGSPIYAADSGVVTSAGYYSGGQGNMVAINHGNGYETEYMHLSEIAVSPGESVARGQVIGYEGDSGYTFGGHLHFEIHYNGVSLDPMLFF